MLKAWVSIRITGFGGVTNRIGIGQRTLNEFALDEVTLDDGMGLFKNCEYVT